MKFVFTCVIAALHLGAAHLGAETQAVDRGAGGDLRVMSWNILYRGWEKQGHPSWEKRIPNVVRILREQEPDVVGLQEDSKAQVAYLAKALPGYRYLQPYKNKGGGLLIRTEAWQVVESGKIPIPGGRHASWALLESIRDGERWLFYNAHLIHRTAPDSAAARMEGARRIVEHMVGYAPANVPIVFTGDFNALHDMPVMQYLGGNTEIPMKFSNAFNLIHGPDDPRGTWRGLGNEHHLDRIDHVLINEQVSVRDAEILFYDELPGVYPSDHYPVQVTLGRGGQHVFREKPKKSMKPARSIADSGAGNERKEKRSR